MSKGFASTPRIALLAVLVLLVFAGIGARLAWLHVIDRDELLRFVEKARRQILVQTARRGDILDTHGAILATSRSLIVLGVDPQALVPADERKWPQLAELLGMPLPQLTRILTTKSRPAQPAAPVSAQAPTPEPSEAAAAPGQPLNFWGAAAVNLKASAQSDDDTVFGDADAQGTRQIRWTKLSDTVTESGYAEITKLDVRGVYGQRVYRRDYPHNDLAAHVVGYVNRDEVPVTGIERFADFYLRGQDGWVESEKDGRREELAQFRTREVPPSDGYSVVLSIDAEVQHIAEAELAAIAAKYQPAKATIIVSDPRTGFILGLANYPSFDLNTYNKLPADGQGAMRNTAVADMYEPGSVFKIVAASGALQEGLVTPSTTFDCNLDKIDYRGLTRSLPRDDDHFDHRLSVAEIISHSSNRGAAQLGMMLGERKFYDYACAFGFGRPTGFPVGGEVGGFLLPPDKWDGLTITRMPTGYSVDVTVLQMNQAMETIASGGVLLRPQIVREIRDPTGEVVYRFRRCDVHRVLSERTAQTMARLLTGVVSPDGTAPDAAIPGYEVAGKTGTVRKIIDHQYSDAHHVASFIGFFPASRPQVVISVVVDDADAHTPGGIAWGRVVAAPAFKHIGEQLIPYLDITPAMERPLGTGLAMGGNQP
jgi:cell division protein FtsI/penicillin-binding protein 2